MEFPYKNKNRLTYDSEIPLLVIYPEKEQKKKKIHVSKCSLQHYLPYPELGSNQMCINRGIDKKMGYVYTTEYYLGRKRNYLMPLTATWMDLEIISD